MAAAKTKKPATKAKKEQDLDKEDNLAAKGIIVGLLFKIFDAIDHSKLSSYEIFSDFDVKKSINKLGEEINRLFKDIVNSIIRITDIILKQSRLIERVVGIAEKLSNNQSNFADIAQIFTTQIKEMVDTRERSKKLEQSFKLLLESMISAEKIPSKKLPSKKKTELN